MKHTSTKEVGLEQFVDILSESEIMSTVDFGSVIMHDVRHPSMGGLTMMNSAGGQCAIVTAS